MIWVDDEFRGEKEITLVVFGKAICSALFRVTLFNRDAKIIVVFTYSVDTETVFNVEDDDEDVSFV